MKSKGCRKLPAGGFLLITSARKDGKARILWKTCVASGELAEKKVGPAVGFDRTCVNAIRAEAFVGSFLRQCRISSHGESLAGAEWHRKSAQIGMGFGRPTPLLRRGQSAPTFLNFCQEPARQFVEAFFLSLLECFAGNQFSADTESRGSRQNVA